MSVTIPTQPRPPEHPTRATTAQFLVDLCHFFGADLATGLQVAALFIRDFEDTPEGMRLRG